MMQNISKYFTGAIQIYLLFYGVALMHAQSKQIPLKGYQNGITEHFPLYFDKDEARIRKRLQGYEKLGMEMIRTHAFPGKLPVYLDVLDEFDFRVKMILYATPRLKFTDQNGKQSNFTANFWHPDCQKQVVQKNRQILNTLKRHPIWTKVDYIIPTLGPAGELTYPPTWTTNLPHPTFWCYGPHAQVDFRKQMQLKYGDLEKANQTWGTNYVSWPEVKVEKPGKYPGSYWQDLLTWYRDSKRKFARWHIESIRKLTDKRVIIYIPGEHYTQAHWDEAVRTAGKRANALIKAMLDSDFLIELATEHDCDLQYTALSRHESQYIAGRAKEMGFKGLIYGENAGAYGPASRPLDLAKIVQASRFAGLDYTASMHLFEKDLITPNLVYRELGDAFLLLKGKTPPQRWTNKPTYLSGIESGDTAIWTHVAEVGERFGLHAMHDHGNLAPEIRQQKKAWRIVSGQRSASYLYFAIQHPKIGMGRSRKVDLFVQYFDEGQGSVTLEYDSSDASVRKVAGQPGAFKVHPARIVLADTKTWQVMRFSIQDAEFSNRCNVRDFRLAVKGPAPLLIRSAGLVLK